MAAKSLVTNPRGIPQAPFVVRGAPLLWADAACAVRAPGTAASHTLSPTAPTSHAHACLVFFSPQADVGTFIADKGVPVKDVIDGLQEQYR